MWEVGGCREEDAQIRFDTWIPGIMSSSSVSELHTFDCEYIKISCPENLIPCQVNRST